MKRYNGLHDKLCTIENIEVADDNARKNKNKKCRDKTRFYSIHRLNHFPINFKITKYDWCIYAKNRKEKVKLKT